MWYHLYLPRAVLHTIVQDLPDCKETNWGGAEPMTHGRTNNNHNGITTRGGFGKTGDAHAGTTTSIDV